MISASDYRKENKNLMIEYEQKVRKWLFQNGKKEISDSVPFFRDGVTCPEVWFKEGNDFRPLFILKEVSLGTDNIKDFLKTWGNQKYFEFAENPFDDVQIGKFKTWKRIARLAKALEDIHNGEDAPDYESYDLSFRQGGEEYTGDIDGYKQYGRRSANPIYQEIISKIAFLEIKKIGSGKSVGSELSKDTLYFTKHIEPFEDLISRQINLIDPTVIICCGKESNKWIGGLLTEIRDKTGDRCWIDSFHPAAYGRYAKKYFFEEPLKLYKEYRNNVISTEQ